MPILTYHKISPVNKQSIYPGTFVPPKLFQRHLKYLSRKGFQSVRLDSIFSESSPAKPIVLTFDDGFQDFEDEAMPILDQWKMRATVFLVSDYIGRFNSWDVKIGDISAPLMNLDSIKRLHEQGIEFGSHTKTHARLTAIDSSDQEEEIRGSKAALEEMLGFPIDTFCYPYGAHDERIVELVRQAGYKYATVTLKGLNTGAEDPMMLKRIAIRNDTPLPTLIYKLWRAYKFGR